MIAGVISTLEVPVSTIQMEYTYHVKQSVMIEKIGNLIIKENVPVENSLVYARALSKFEIPYELHIYPFGDHGGSTFDEQSLYEVNDIAKYNSRWVKEAGKWLKLMNLFL